MSPTHKDAQKRRTFAWHSGGRLTANTPLFMLTDCRPRQRLETRGVRRESNTPGPGAGAF